MRDKPYITHFMGTENYKGKEDKDSVFSCVTIGIRLSISEGVPYFTHRREKKITQMGLITKTLIFPTSFRCRWTNHKTTLVRRLVFAVIESVLVGAYCNTLISRIVTFSVQCRPTLVNNHWG